MSIRNFVPTIWIAEVMKTFETSHVIASLCNTKYEGAIKSQGDTVKISSIGEITVSDYTPNSTTISFQTLQAAQTKLLIDQCKYFAFEIDDVDAAQANVDVMPAAMQKAAYKMSETIDTALALLYSQAAHTVTDASCDTSLIFQTLASAREYLDIEGVPKEGRWVVLPPWVITKLVLGKLLTTEGSVNAENAFANGFVGRCMGFNVHESNNLYQTGSDPSYTTYCMAGVPEAISYAEQVVNIEALRRESGFADAVKGFNLYGYKVVQPKGLVQLVLTYAAETS